MRFAAQFYSALRPASPKRCKGCSGQRVGGGGCCSRRFVGFSSSSIGLAQVGVQCNKAGADDRVENDVGQQVAMSDAAQYGGPGVQVKTIVHACSCTAAAVGAV